MIVNKEDNNDDGVDFCPLFMDALPPNFADNPALSAIASLLKDDESQTREKISKKNNAHIRLIRGGGKICKRKNLQHSRRSKPYEKATNSKATSIAEAQLYLKMWKI